MDTGNRMVVTSRGGGQGKTERAKVVRYMVMEGSQGVGGEYTVEYIDADYKVVHLKLIHY